GPVRAMASPATAVAWGSAGARGGAVQAMLDGPDSPLPLKANTRYHTCWSLVSPASTNDGGFQGLVPIVAQAVGVPSQVAPPSVARSTRNPSPFTDWSVQETTTLVLPFGTAWAFEGALGGEPAVNASAAFEKYE